MNRKDSHSGPSNPKRKSSLGLKSWINSGSDDKVVDAPSTSRPQMVQRSNSNLGVPPSFNFSMSSRIPRTSSTRESRGRRSTSQEPPSVRRYQAVSPSNTSQEVYMQSVGMLITPVRPTPSRSPGGLSLGSSCKGSIARRLSTNKMQIPGTASKFKDERPVTDKLFQANAIGRIQNFFRSIGMQAPSLKPMSNSVLILAFNTIIGVLDPTIRVSNADYVEKIPMYLRHLQYQGSINKTSLVGVGSGHAGMQLIAMLAWLVDSVEALKKCEPERILFPHAETNNDDKLNKAGLKTLFAAYQKFRANEASTSAEDFQDMLCNELGISQDGEHQLANEIESLQEQLNNLHSDPCRLESEEKVRILDEAENRMHEFKIQRDKLGDVLASKRTKIEEQKKHIVQLDTELSRLDDHIAEVQDKVDCQVMKASERDALRVETVQLRDQVEHFSGYLEKLKDSVGRIDIDMSKERKKVGDITHIINCTVLETGLDEKLKWTMNPVHCVDVELYVAELKNSWEKTTLRLTKEVEAQKAALLADKKETVKLQEELNKKEELIKKKTEELRSVDSEIVSSQINCKMQEESLISETEKAKEKCIELQNQLDQYPKLEHLEDHIKKILEVKEKVQEEHEAFKDLQENKVFPALIEMIDEWQDSMVKTVKEAFTN